MTEWMEMQEDEHLREIYGALNRYQVGSALAGWVLKAINRPYSEVASQEPGYPMDHPGSSYSLQRVESAQWASF